MLQAQLSWLQLSSLQVAPLGECAPETRNGTGGADNLQSTFIQNISHELRTPLGIIQGYAELLRDGDLGALATEQQQAAFAIANRAYELRTLVERIGVLLAVEAHATISLPLMLDEVATKAVERRRTAAAQAGIELELHLEPALSLVSGDPYQLQQAVDCLIENALKFTPGGGRVEVRVYTEPGWVCLAVTDTGIGMTEQESEHIFTGFYQADSSTTRQHGGIGLGLTVAKAVIEEHAGRMDVEIQPGQGSRFTTRLPTLPSATQVDQPIKRDVVSRRILIVDDEVNVALALHDGLEKLPNCEIVVATGGEQALRLFEEQPFDLLITDYKMPDMDGVALAARVRQLHPQTAIIMITAYASDILYEQATHVSIQRVLDKPLRLMEIRSVALEALEEGGIAQ